MNQEFTIYEEEFLKYQNRMMAKFHTAPHATQYEQQEIMEEYQQAKQAFEGMQLTCTPNERPRMNKYRTEFVELKNGYQQYCPNAGVNMIMKQNEQLREYTKTAYEAEGLAIGTQFELRNQTTKLNHMINQTKGTQQDIGDAETLLNRMKNRGCLMKALTYSMVLLILIGIGVIIWYKFTY